MHLFLTTLLANCLLLLASNSNYCFLVYQHCICGPICVLDPWVPTVHLMPHAVPPCPKFCLKVEGNAMLPAVLGPNVATCAQGKCVFDGVVVEDVLRLCNEHKEAQKPLQAHDEHTLIAKVCSWTYLICPVPVNHKLMAVLCSRLIASWGRDFATDISRQDLSF